MSDILLELFHAHFSVLPPSDRLLGHEHVQPVQVGEDLLDATMEISLQLNELSSFSSSSVSNSSLVALEGEGERLELQHPVLDLTEAAVCRVVEGLHGEWSEVAEAASKGYKAKVFVCQWVRERERVRDMMTDDIDD